MDHDLPARFLEAILCLCNSVIKITVFYYTYFTLLVAELCLPNRPVPSAADTKCTTRYRHRRSVYSLHFQRRI